MRHGVINALVVAASMLVAVIGCEIGLRYLYPHGALGSGVELEFFRHESARWMSVLMVPDEVIGFRPKLNTEGGYDKHGLLRRSHTDEGIVRRRILLLGDSVTARGRIVNAIEKVLHDPTTEFLNGGVEAFNLAQEVDFFLRFQSAVEVDHIIHQVHGNDLRATPIAFRDENGALNVYQLNSPKQYVNLWLFQNSYFYRVGLAVFLSRITEADTLREARNNFARMAAFAAERGIKYDVVLFPILLSQDALRRDDRSDWKILERACRETVQHCVSLLPVLDRMLAGGQPVEEALGDSWHPNDAFAAAAAPVIVEALGLRPPSRARPRRSREPRRGGRNASRRMCRRSSEASW